MTSNLFESAIAANEVNEFFRGYGKYLVPSPDYDGHVHGAHMGGHARTYADLTTSNAMQFDAAFLSFLESLSVTPEDLNHLLANLSAYFAQKSRGGFSESHLFDSIFSSGSALLKNYLKKIGQASFAKDGSEKIHRHATFIQKKGNSVVVDIINGLDNI